MKKIHYTYISSSEQKMMSENDTKKKRSELWTRAELGYPKHIPGATFKRPFVKIIIH